MSKSGLALRRISGHCTVTADKIHAWYLLDPQGWSFRPDSVREQLIIDGADTYAQLVKRSIHIRVTTRPYPVSRWAADHDANAARRVAYTDESDGRALTATVRGPGTTRTPN